MRLTNWSDFILPSTLQLQVHVETLLEPVKSPKRREQIQLGLHEALVNAVRHGNSCDPSRSLRVRRIITPNWLIWQIQDEGKGFDFSERDFRLPSDIESENGRGLFLIHECFDDVRWSKKGRRLQLSCHRERASNEKDNQDL